MNFRIASPPGVVRLRPATLADIATLRAWDREPHVIACSSDLPGLEVAFDGIDWPTELAEMSEVSFYRIAEVVQDGAWRSIGALQVIDPHLEPTHYWGAIEPNLRAIDIWIGPPDALNKGYGTQMMSQAIDAAFASQSARHRHRPAEHQYPRASFLRAPRLRSRRTEDLRRR